MTPSNIAQWLDISALVISLANTVWMWISRPARELRGDLEKADAELTERCNRHREELLDHKTRIERVEGEMRHLPTKDDLGKVLQMISGMKAELDIVVRTVNRIDDHLRKAP